MRAPNLIVLFLTLAIAVPVMASNTVAQAPAANKGVAKPAASKPADGKSAGAKAAKLRNANETLALVRSFYERAPGPDHLLFSARLEKFRAAALARSREIDAPVAGLDFAFYLNAQDAEIGYLKSLRIAQIRNDGKRARVRATMRNYRPVELWFDLVREGEQWRIDEVQSRRDPRWTLSRLYMAGAKEK